MVEQEKERRPFLTKLSEEAQNALNIAGAIAPKLRNPFLKPGYYIEPLHLVVGLTKQPSVRELLVKGGVDPDKMSNVLIMFRPAFEADCNPKEQSGKDGDLSDRAKFAMGIASGMAGRAGKQEISALDMASGIILEDLYHKDNERFIVTHDVRRLLLQTSGSLLESIISQPPKRKAEGETEKEEKHDNPPEVS